MKKVIIHSAQHLIVFMSIALFIASCAKKENEIDEANLSTQALTKSTTQQTLEPQSIESLVAAYQQTHKDENLDTANLINVFNTFTSMMQSNEKFGDKKPAFIQPIYSYGIDGVAYHEIWFVNADKKVEGWVLLSATDKDYPVVSFSHGTPYSLDLANKAGNDGKIYRFGVSYYALEQNGVKTAEHGQMPTSITNTSVDKSEGGMIDSKNLASDTRSTLELKEGVDYFPVNSYNDLKKLFPKYYFNAERAQNANKMEQKFFKGNNRNSLSTRAYNYRWVSGAHGYYTQIPAYTTFNPYGCWSGCNNNAWANIYAWWDLNKGKANLIPTTSTGETCPLYRNTYARQASSDPVQMYCRSVAGTYCGGDGGGWTLWSRCGDAAKYAGAKGYGYTYYYQWCNSAGCNVNLANIVTDGIANNYRPVQIGANSHFYVGYGWCQWDTNTDWTWAYCYPGWKENNNDDVWILWHDFNSSVKMFIY